jgi:hypothetical protein
MEKAIRVPIRSVSAPSHSVTFAIPWGLWASVGLVAVVVRLGYGVWSGRLWQPETWEYERIADHLLRGDGFVFEHMNTVYRSYAEPLYPFLVAGVYALTQHSQWTLVLVQIALSAVTALVALQCASRLTQDPRIAALAGMLVAIHPGLVIYTMKLHPLVLDVLFLTLVAWSSLCYGDRPTARRVAVIGAVSGFCALTRPTVLAVVPLVCWWIWRTTNTSVSIRLGRVALMLGVLGALVSPWVIRNYAVHSQFMLTRSNTPFVFWLGNNPQATGSSLDKEGRELFMLAPPEFRASIEAADERTQNRLFGEAAWAYIRSDPWGFVWRTWQKWIYFWWFTPQAGHLYPPGWLDLYRVWWAGLACAGLYGLWAAPTLAPVLRIRIWFLIGMGGMIGAIQSLFYIEGRHRLAVEPMLSGIIAFGAFQLWTRCRRRLLRQPS